MIRVIVAQFDERNVETITRISVDMCQRARCGALESSLSVTTSSRLDRLTGQILERAISDEAVAFKLSTVSGPARVTCHVRGDDAAARRQVQGRRSACLTWEFKLAVQNGQRCHYSLRGVSTNSARASEAGTRGGAGLPACGGTPRPTRSPGGGTCRPVGGSSLRGHGSPACAVGPSGTGTMTAVSLAFGCYVPQYLRTWHGKGGRRGATEADGCAVR